MSELVIDGLHPHSLAFVDTAALPVLWMHQIDAAVLESSSRGPTPVDILVPFDTRLLDIIKPAEIRNSLPKLPSATIMEIRRQFTVDFAALRDWGYQHSHRRILRKRSDNRNSFHC